MTAAAAEATALAEYLTKITNETAPEPTSPASSAQITAGPFNRAVIRDGTGGVYAHALSALHRECPRFATS
jgi:hypothetical protein